METPQCYAVCCWCAGAGASGLRGCLSELFVMSRAIGHGAVLWVRVVWETKQQLQEWFSVKKTCEKRARVRHSFDISVRRAKTLTVTVSCSLSSCRYSCWAEADGRNLMFLAGFTDDTVFKCRKSDTYWKCSCEMFVMAYMLRNMIIQETCNAGCRFWIII